MLKHKMIENENLLCISPLSLFYRPIGFYDITVSKGITECQNKLNSKFMLRTMSRY